MSGLPSMFQDKMVGRHPRRPIWYTKSTFTSMVDGIMAVRLLPSPFAIVWSGAGGNPAVVTVVNPPVVVGGYTTTTRTVIVVGVITTTIYVTEVVQAASQTPVGTVVVAPAPTTVTITNTAQLNTITQTVVGATTIGGSPVGNSPQAQLYNSDAAKINVPCLVTSVIAVVLGILIAL